MTILAIELSSLLIPFAVIAGVALVLGILLAVLSHFFAVPEDPTFGKIRECLPGINCGACGYKGCDDYASALADGSETRPNLCIPGAQVVADEIGGILGVEAEAFEDKVAFVACNGHYGATVDKALYEGVPSCAAAARLYGGPGVLEPLKTGGGALRFAPCLCASDDQNEGGGIIIHEID